MTRLPPFSSLLSPPEQALLNDFDHPQTQFHQHHLSGANFAMGATKQSPELVRAMQPISPPVSPQVALQSNAAPATISHGTHDSVAVPDPVLFPESTQRDEPSAEALFPYASDDLLKHAIRKHIARRDVPSKSGDPRHARHLAAMPTEDEYLGFVQSAPRILALYRRDPVAYVRTITAHNKYHLDLIRGKKSEPVVHKERLSRTSSSEHKQSRIAVSGRVTKPLPPKRAPARRSAHVPAKALRQATPDEKAPIKKKTEDVDFEALPDLAPPLSTLDDGRVLRLRAEWAASPLDLSQDPHRHLLHPSELTIASALRLSCATYLCSKRRIFITRLESLKKGKEFRKTDAQQACKIDVNKASRLWVAYDSVGWFRSDYFTKHIGLVLE